MTKKRFLVLCTCFALLCSMIGCGPAQDTNADYSGYAFADVAWTREGDCDIETLRFKADGSFQYSCACGNPVNDADVVESYSYDEKTKTFTLNCLEELEGMVTEIVLVSCDGETLELDFDGEVRSFVKEGTEKPGFGKKIDIDLRKVNLLVEDLADPALVQAARNVVDAFLLYEENAWIEVKGDTQQFITDMMYIVQCTCPMFENFVDYDEATAYDASTSRVSWKFRVTKDELDAKVQQFTKITEDYLSVVSLEDSEAMRAILLYQDLGKELKYTNDLIATNNAQTLMFLYTQAGLDAGTVSYTDNTGEYMWNLVLIDGKYYYCDLSRESNGTLKCFGLTDAENGTMLGTEIREKYEFTGARFDDLRSKVPADLTGVEVDHEKQTIKFVGQDGEYIFECK